MEPVTESVPESVAGGMQIGRRPTIGDVAALAGVSRTSVSRVLNGRGELSEATRERVRAAIAELGYHPSEVARSLSSQRTKTIGIIVYDILNPGMAEGVYGAQMELAGRGYRAILACQGGQVEAGRRCLELLEDRRVDGIITNALTDPDLDGSGSHLLPRFQTNGMHCYDPQSGRVSVAKFDEVSGGYQAATHLIDQGHRRIGIISGPRWWGAMEERLSGYRAAFVDRGLDDDQTRVVKCDAWTVPAGYAATHQLLDLAPDVTAIWALYDILAVGVIRALTDRGKRVPDDVAVVGYNDESFASHLVPRLTSVIADCNTLGQAAAKLVLELLDDERAPPRHVIVPTKLIGRESTRQVCANVSALSTG